LTNNSQQFVQKLNHLVSIANKWVKVTFVDMALYEVVQMASANERHNYSWRWCSACFRMNTRYFSTACCW
jgi:hypothetical protein